MIYPVIRLPPVTTNTFKFSKATAHENFIYVNSLSFISEPSKILKNNYANYIIEFRSVKL
jgi:hypothetical protein